MARAQLVDGLPVTVSLATAAGRSSLYSEAKPRAVSVAILFQPAAEANVWPATSLLKPSAVITSSAACVVAPPVETVALVDPALTAVPVWSSAVAPVHSVSWASALIVAGLIVNVGFGTAPR